MPVGSEETTSATPDRTESPRVCGLVRVDLSAVTTTTTGGTDPGRPRQRLSRAESLGCFEPKMPLEEKPTDSVLQQIKNNNNSHKLQILVKGRVLNLCYYSHSSNCAQPKSGCH